MEHPDSRVGRYFVLKPAPTPLTSFLHSLHTFMKQ